jgi:hypothetical protein
MSDKRGMTSNAHERIAGLFETRLKLHEKDRMLSADSFRLTANAKEDE